MRLNTHKGDEMGLDTLSLVQMEELAVLKKIGVLQPLEGHYLSTQQQTFICFCGDGKHALDLTRFHAALCGVNQDLDNELFHKVALNGGALVLSDNPLAKLRGLPQDLVGLMNVEYALKLKGSHGYIALYIHAPCGAAKEAGMLSLVDIVDQGLRAKLRVQNVFPAAIFSGSVRCYFHVCKDNGCGEIARNTYFTSKDAWEKWLLLPQNEERKASWDAYKKKIAKDSGWIPEALITSLKEKGQLPQHYTQ